MGGEANSADIVAAEGTVTELQHINGNGSCSPQQIYIDETTVFQKRMTYRTWLSTGKIFTQISGCQAEVNSVFRW